MRRSLPLYVQIESVLKERVRTGLYPAGVLMPGEDRLRTEFGVSRATIRLALDALHRNGLISRYAGHGTVVNETHDQPQSLRLKGSINEVITLADGAPVDFVVTAHVMTEATAAEASELKLAEGWRVLRVAGLRRCGEERVAHMVACIPEALEGLLTPRDREACPPIIALLRERLGVTVRQARLVIGAGVTDPVAAAALGVAVGMPLLTARRTYFAADGTPLEFAISSYPGNTYQFETIISGGV